MWTRLLVLLSRWRAALGASEPDRDFRAELRTHLELLADEQRRRGAHGSEATRRACLQLGGVAQLEEERRESRGIRLVEETLRDVGYAIRTLRRSRVFALVSIATLAIGIGAGTVVLSFTHAVLLRPLPYHAPGDLVRIFEANPLRRWTRNTASPANYADWRRLNGVFTDIAAWEQFGSDVFLTGSGDPQALRSARVTSNLFDVLGVRPLRGRTFTPDEMFAGRERSVVISEGLWRGVFAGDPEILGRTLVLNGLPCEVVGVMPRGFFFPGRDVQVWQPVAYAPDLFTTARRPHWLGVVARLKPRISLRHAGDEMDRIAAALEREYPDTNTRMGVRLEPFQASLAHDARPALLMLSGAVALLFLIVCVNIANLQLGRAWARVQELATRRALGAGRGRLLRQLLIEGLVLAACGGAIGALLAVPATAALVRLAGRSIPVFAQVTVNRPVLLGAAGLTLLAVVLFGAVPALAASRTQRLSTRGTAGSRDATRVRSLLVAAEVALSVVVVVGSLLLVRSLARLSDVDPGVDPDGIVTFSLTLPALRYPDARAQLAAFEAIEQRLRNQPGFQAVGASSAIALRATHWTGDLTIEGRAADDYARDVRHASVTADYFKTMGIPILQGRAFDAIDRADRAPTTIVNETMARQLFRGEPPIGRRVRFGRPQDVERPWIEVVGVVADEKQDGLHQAAEPLAYQSLAQRVQNPMTFALRTVIEAEAALAAARRQVALVDKDLALTSAATMHAIVEDALGAARLRTLLLSSFAIVALLLAALGTYGVLAYLVSQRNRELALRHALGARRAELFRLVIGQGLRPVFAGAITGLAAAVAVSGLIESLLFGVSPIDPATYAIATLLLMLAGAAASALPAWRATRVDSLPVLRDC